MTLTDYLSKKAKHTKGRAKDWLHFCEIDVTSGSLWAGDPHLANADDGCLVKLPNGRYVVEGIGIAQGRDRSVSRLRVRMAEVEDPELGKEIGETGTDSAMIAVCDLKAFDAANKDLSDDEVQNAIEEQTEKGFGVIRFNRATDAVMPFVPTGGDGCGPVFALQSGKKCVGFELSFEPSEDDDSDDLEMEEILLAGDDEAGIIYRRLPDGKLSTFWIGGELRAGLAFYLWCDGSKDPVDYRIRAQDNSTCVDWTPMKKSDVHRASVKLGAGNYEIDFRTQGEVYSALKLSLE